MGTQVPRTDGHGERRLAEGYYVANFETLLCTVVERYRDLLSGDEIRFVDTFRELSLGARRLYVRLISRRGPCFRRDRLDYREIPALAEAIAELTRRRFLDHAEDLASGEVLALLRRDELLDLARRLTPGVVDSPLPKSRLLALLVDRVREPDLDWALRQRIQVLRPRHRQHLLAFRLLFFGNLSQDLTTFVLDDLGVVRYEAYELRPELRLFSTRTSLDHTLELIALGRQMSRLEEHADPEDAIAIARQVVARIAAWDLSTQPLVNRILIRAGRLEERQGKIDSALAFYELAVMPPARERRARLLAQLGREDEAAALCQEIAQQPRDESEAVFAPRFRRRLAKRAGDPLAPLPTPSYRTLHLELDPGEENHVEERVLVAMRESGREGFFAENWLWRSLFGLAFWDVIFAPVAGVFHHPFQRAPLDLYTTDFRPRRAALVETRLAELREDRAPGPRLLALYQAKHPTANQLVAWDSTLRPYLELALSRLSGTQLAWVFDRLSRDPGRYRRGFPDLFIASREPPGFELWEVKGPGDQLRPEQETWLDYLQEGGLPAAVVRVS